MSKLRLDDYVLLGPGGPRVSPLCLRTMTLGTDWGWGAESDECAAMLQLIWAATSSIRHCLSYGMMKGQWPETALAIGCCLQY
jgi:hypothetical protein